MAAVERRFTDKWWDDHPTTQRCHAHRSGTSTQRCRKPAISGALVCTTHGGAASQVQRAAKERLALAADNAIEFITSIMEDPTQPADLRLKAARDLADRNGLNGKTEIELTMPQWQQVLPDILVDVEYSGARPVDLAYERAAAIEAEVVEDPPELRPSAPTEPVKVGSANPPHATADRLGWGRWR